MRKRGAYQTSALIVSLRWVWVFQSASLPCCTALCGTFATWSSATRRHLCLKPSADRFRCANLLRLSSKAHKSWCLTAPDLTNHVANSTQPRVLVIICAEPGVLVWATPKLVKLRSHGSYSEFRHQLEAVQLSFPEHQLGGGPEYIKGRSEA